MNKIIGIGIAALLVLGLFGMYSKYSSLQTTAADYETQLNAQYLDNQNELSTYISKFYESVGIANLKSDKMDQILTDAVKGRYDGNSSAKVGGGQLFSSIKEAYPNIDVSQYDRILDLISAGRDAYKQKQSKLIDMLRGFDKWRVGSGPINKMLISWMHIPDDELVARIGKTSTRGRDAEDQMWTIVTTSSTQKAYDTGTMDPLTVPSDKPAAPAKQ
jgi:hypothetical protein